MGSGHQRVVSLGRSCQPAYQIRRLIDGAPAHVFDWVLNTDTGLVQAIECGLDGWFETDSFLTTADGYVECRRTGTRFLHEFPAGSDFEAQFALHASRVSKLKARWNNLMLSRLNVLFVRQHGWDDDIFGAAVRLRDTLCRAGTRLSFDLLYLTDPALHYPGWSADGIRFAPLPQTVPYDWRGDNAAWGALLAGENVVRRDPVP